MNPFRSLCDYEEYVYILVTEAALSLGAFYAEAGDTAAALRV
jgi:hypothetical protein